MGLVFVSIQPVCLLVGTFNPFTLKIITDIYIPCKWELKKAGVSILILDKIDLKIKKISRDKEGHNIIIKGSIQEEDIIIVSIYVPSIEAL